MKITLVYDLDAILTSDIGRFGIGYYHFRQSEESKNSPNGAEERAFRFWYHLFGTLALFYVHICTRLYYRMLSRQELEDLYIQLSVDDAS